MGHQHKQYIIIGETYIVSFGCIWFLGYPWFLLVIFKNVVISMFVYINKIIIIQYILLVDMEYLFYCLTLYLICSLHSLMRY